MLGVYYCECEAPLIDIDHDAGCRRCGRPVAWALSPDEIVSPERIAELEKLAGFEEWAR